MPVYSYRCDSCETESTDLRRIADRNELVACSNCGRGTLHRNHADELPAVPGSEIGFVPYFDPAVGKHIKSRPQRDAEFKRLGLVPQTYKQQRDNFERLLEKPIPDYKPKPEAWAKAREKGIKKVRAKNVIRING